MVTCRREVDEDADDGAGQDEGHDHLDDAAERSKRMEDHVGNQDHRQHDHDDLHGASLRQRR